VSRAEESRAPLLVLALGNRLLHDDAAGLELLELLRADLSADPRLQLVDGGTLGLSLLGLLEERRAVLVLDAVDLDLRPGACFASRDPMARAAARGMGAHGSNASELLALAELCGRLPERAELVGVQVERVATGIGLTPAVRAGVAAAREVALERVADLLEAIGEAQPCTS
jgi:hydrogenase maturation protease